VTAQKKGGRAMTGNDKGQRQQRKPSDERSTRARSRYAGNPPDGRTPRIFLLAAAVVLVAAAVMFWPRSDGEIPTGIGERITVVTAVDSAIPAGVAIRSGDVEIAKEQKPVIPEQPRDGKPRPEPAATETQPERSANREKETAGARDRSAAATPRPAPPKITPQENGLWAVQVGAFGQEENAAALIAKLKRLGHPAKLRAAGTSGGEIVYRVWIGYFANRADAAAFAQQNRAEIGDGNPVHR
jgi:cell division septation protein DedD